MYRKISLQYNYVSKCSALFDLNMYLVVSAFCVFGFGCAYVGLYGFGWFVFWGWVCICCFSCSVWFLFMCVLGWVCIWRCCMFGVVSVCVFFELGVHLMVLYIRGGFCFVFWGLGVACGFWVVFAFCFWGWVRISCFRCHPRSITVFTTGG